MVVFVSQANDELAKDRLARLIKELRGQKTQREFAKLLGTSYTSVQDWEKQLRLPKDGNLKRIAELKGWTHEELMCFLFLPNARPEAAQTPSLEVLIAQVQNLSLAEMRVLNEVLNIRISQMNAAKGEPMNLYLSDKQKYNLHLLLRASLKHQNPSEAMARTNIAPEVFTDIFLRNDQTRVVTYQDLEEFGGLCCRVIQWKVDQLPEVDFSQTYLGEPEMLFATLANAETGRVLKDSP